MLNNQTPYFLDNSWQIWAVRHLSYDVNSLKTLTACSDQLEFSTNDESSIGLMPAREHFIEKQGCFENSSVRGLML